MMTLGNLAVQKDQAEAKSVCSMPNGFVEKPSDRRGQAEASPRVYRGLVS